VRELVSRRRARATTGRTRASAASRGAGAAAMGCEGLHEELHQWRRYCLGFSKRVGLVRLVPLIEASFSRGLALKVERIYERVIYLVSPKIIWPPT
jgi:hypothetical protein